MKFTTIILVAIGVAVTLAAPMLSPTTKGDKAVIGYFEPLHGFPIDQFDFSKYTHINYAFGAMWKGAPDPYLVYVDYATEGPKIKELVRRGHANGVKIIMSIGGWYGSQTFSEVAADPVKRKKWIESAMTFLRTNTLGDNATVPNGWNMDGLDIDWEFPGRPGAICNTVSPNDTANYLLLLQEVRVQMDLEFPTNHKTITSAVSIFPWAGADGNSLTDVQAFIPVFDWVNIMVYDVHGPWSTSTGPNAPLYNAPAPGDPLSAQQAVDTWTAAGWPKDKIALGTPFYGRAFTTTVNMNTRDPVTQYAPHTGVAPKGGPSDSNATFALCDEGAQYWGFWNWGEIREHILIDDSFTIPAAGWKRYWDNTTKTPWLFRESDSMYISYDDPTSMSLKVDFARLQGLKGLFMWESQMDYKDELLTVLNQIHCSSAACVCYGVGAWNSTVVYGQPERKVVYNGRLWTNKWWTHGETPSGTEWGAWKDNGVC
ncbi:glycosyl hydrolases family 18-domain-containing protein [Linnemannia elongata]|nr:glycosyl hydrolases family 18-domain-containing protein [Linnemannia elongata]